MVAELARSITEERLIEARGGRELQRYLGWEFKGRTAPPTAIPVRWTSPAYKPLTRLRLWFARGLRRAPTR